MYKMKTHKKPLNFYFSEYETLIAQHIHMMKNESMPDLAAMTRESDLAFIQLKQNLNNFVENNDTSDDGLPILAEYKTRLTSIIAVSEELSGIIENYRNHIKTSLKKMQQGKTALHGYKTAIMNY